MEVKPKTVIVPLDGSKAAEQALPLAGTLANVFGACLDVVHVVDDLRAAVSDTEMEAVAIFTNFIHVNNRHCEERSDEAIQLFAHAGSWIASLRSQ